MSTLDIHSTATTFFNNSLIFHNDKYQNLSTIKISRKYTGWNWQIENTHVQVLEHTPPVEVIDFN